MSDERLLEELAADVGALRGDDTRQATLSALLDALAARPGERAEDVLLDLHLVDERRLAVALALRSGRRFEGLRGLEPDPRLFLYVPLVLAERERVVPLVLVGDTLTLASAYLDPSLDPFRERFPHLDVELVISPRSEILDALRRVEP